LVLGLSAHGPSSLGDPNILASNGSLSCSQSGVEQALAIIDAVDHGVLEVWVRVHSDEVAVVNNGITGAVNPIEASQSLSRRASMFVNIPSSPSIDVTNGDIGQPSALDSSTDLVDIRGNSRSVGTDTSVGGLSGWRVTVEILTSNGDTNHELGERVSVQGDGGVESVNLG
jgi:hypothetical protein